jgi:hypothetical protein
VTGDDPGPTPAPPAGDAAIPPPVAPTAPLPLAEVATVARPHSLVRALLLSGLILLAGAALGAGGFVLEQSQATWRPQVTATGSGWHISTSHGLRLGSAGLGGERLAWEAGPFTVLTDLRSGRSRLLGAADIAGGASPPSVSDRFVVWLQAPAYGASGAAVWVYDVARGRRTRLEGIHGISQSPAVSGTTAVWETFARGGAQQIDGVDLVTGRRFSLGPSGGASQLVISGSLVAWVAPRPGPPAPPVITVVDLADGHRWHVAPYPLSQGSDVLGIALAGRTLVWGRSTPADDEILTYDLDTAAVRMIAQGVGHSPLAADGDLVVWAQPSPAGDTRVVGLRLSGGQPFTMATVSGGMVRDVYVSGKTVAWNVAGSLLFDTYLQTTRLP